MERFGDRVNPLFGCNRVLRIAAVDRIAGESRLVAQVLQPSPAIFADLVGMVQPRYAYPRAHLETMRPFAKFRDHANHLMTRNEWRLAGRQLAFDDMQIGAADRTGANP